MTMEGITMQTATLEAPPLAYWECMWNTLHRKGWHLSHYAFQDGNGLAHMVRARHGADELMCSAPSLSLAVQVIYNQFMAMPPTA